MAAKSQATNIALIQQQLKEMSIDIKDIKKSLKDDYVTKDQFAPVKRIAYGAMTVVSGIIVSVFAYIITAGGRTPTR